MNYFWGIIVGVVIVILLQIALVGIGLYGCQKVGKQCQFVVEIKLLGEPQ